MLINVLAYKPIAINLTYILVLNLPHWLLKTFRQLYFELAVTSHFLEVSIFPLWFLNLQKPYIFHIFKNRKVMKSQ